MEEIGFQYISKSFENKEFVSRINSIYHHMQDEVSKTIFYNRVMYSMTDEPIFMRNVLLNTEMGRNLNKALESKQSLYIYGAGRRGKRLVDMFPEKNWKGLFDTQKIGEYHGIKIMPVFSKKSNENSVVIISNYVGFETIKDNLKKFGWKDQEIIVMGEYDKEMARNMHYRKRK